MASSGPTEEQYLAHESAIATEALSRVKTELLANLKLAGDPLAWAEKYPLPAVGTAAAGGFAAAAVVKPMIFGSSRSNDQNGHAAAGYSPYPYPPQQKSPSTLKRLAAPLISMAKNSIKSAIIAGISAKGAAEAVKDDVQESPVDQATTGDTAVYTSSGL